MRQELRKGVMMRLLLGAMVGLVLLSTPAQAWEWRWPWASADESANKLFVEAVPLWNQYQALPEQDPAQYEARLQLLNQIDKNLKSILKDYPESLLAVELVSTGAIKQLNQEQIEGEIPRLQQSIPASALMAEMLPLGQQYQALPQDDPAQYEARLKLITQIDANSDKILKEYPLSYEAENLSIDAQALKAKIRRLQQSIPASALMAKTSPLWEQYQTLPTDDPAQYEARLKLLTQVDVNLDKLLKDYPQSYEAENLSIDTIAIKVEIQLLQQSIPASALMAEISPLWEQYQALPTDDPAQYEARLKLLTQVDGNLDTLLKNYPQSYEVENLSIDTESIKAEIERLACASDAQCLWQLAWITAELINSATDRGSAFAAIASAQVASGDVEGALKTAKAIDDAPFYRASAFSAIAGAQAARGDVVGALKTANAINSIDSESAFVAIAGAQAAAGDVEGALKTAEAIDTPFYRISAFAAIASAQVAAGDVEGALKTAEAINTPLYPGLVFAAIASAQVAAGDVEGALKTARAIDSPNDRASAFAAIASAQVAAGDVESALKTAEGIDDLLARTNAFVGVAKAAAKLK